MIFGFRNDRRARPANRRAARRVLESLERRDLMALVVGPLSLEQDVPFQGRVATFAAGDLQGTIADFKPTITWGDGASSTDAAIIPDGPDAFAIIASKTYEQPGKFSVGVMVSGAGNSAIFDDGVATVIGVPPTRSEPTTITATAGQPFSGAVAGFTAPTTAGGAADFSATVDWGDGRVDRGAVAARSGGDNAGFVVTATHEYATPGAFTARVTIIRASDGLALSFETPTRVYAFAGGLAPTSVVDQAPGVVITNQQLPSFWGTAEPQATIRLSTRRDSAGAPIPLGETIADAAGRWSMIAGPLGEQPFYLYGTVTPTGAGPSPAMLLNDGRAILVDVHLVRPISATINAAGNRAVVLVGGGGRSGPGAEPIWLNQPESYVLIDSSGRSHQPTSARPARASRARPGAVRPVTLSFARGSLPRGGELRLDVVSRSGPIPGGVPIASLVVGRGRRG